MIEQLSGTLSERDLTQAVVDVGGIGFGVSVPLSTSDVLPPAGSPVTLRTVMLVRDEEFRLYGFATEREKRLFRLLTGAVSGVGPKLALNVLSCMSVDVFISAVLQGDLKVLSKISGVGKRTAERMVLELKDKVGGLSESGSDACGSMPGGRLTGVSAGSGSAGSGGLNSPSVRDAVLALETLGFKREQSEKVLLGLVPSSGDVPTAEQLIRKALAALNS